MWIDHGELFQRCKTNPILTVEDWPYKAHSVFNPAATIVNGTTLLMVRVEDHRGFSYLTVAKSLNGIDSGEIDSEPTLVPDPINFPEEIYGIEDPRVHGFVGPHEMYERGGDVNDVVTQCPE